MDRNDNNPHYVNQSILNNNNNLEHPTPISTVQKSIKSTKRI